MGERGDIFNKIDWLSVILYFVLVFFGWINIYASVYNEDAGNIFSLGQRYGKQLIWIAIAFGIILLIFLIDSNAMSQLALFIYGFMIVLLVSVLLFGKEVNGARSWFEFGSFRVQPSEFTKFATALAVAALLNRENFSVKKIRDLMILAGIILLPAGLIILQHDTGSALVYAAFILPLYRQGLPGAILVFGFIAVLLFLASFFFHLLAIFLVIYLIALLFFALSMKEYQKTLLHLFSTLLFFSAGLMLILFANLNIELDILLAASVILSSIIAGIWAYKSKVFIVLYIVPAVITAISFTYSVDYIFNRVLEEHQRVRVNVLLGIEDDVKGAGYNVHQSKIAIGSGGLTGKGFLQGTQTKYDFVPEQDTDFIFCTVGEEWGFAGTAGVVLIFTFFISRIVFLAERQRSIFSRVYGYSVASILFVHVAVNIGMTIGLAPGIGIPLPFFSYGGSSLWAFTILLFIFLRLDISRNETL